MICPHCEKSLLRRERTGNVSSKCGCGYALDPKSNPLKLSDLQVRRIAHVLTRDGQVPCACGRLWDALSRKSLPDSGVQPGCAAALTLVRVVLQLIGLGADAVVFTVVSGLMLLTAADFVLARLAGMGRGRPPVARDAFRTGLLADWRSVYGGLPPGVVDDSSCPRAAVRPVRDRAGSVPDGTPGTAGPAGGPVLVCPDRSIAVFLDAA
ncbi:hypothetical protein [Streptomyces sp. NPDC006012]|uniref:hypothetical protein n=1 Tax=Streptomyces sp. NPDC006012 TaxID=3364739 RepID=UPI0036806DDD